MNEEYQKIAYYVLRIFSLTKTMSFSCRIEAGRDRLILFPVSQYNQKLPLSLDIVHVSTLKRLFEEMVVIQQDGYYQLEIPYTEIVERHEIQKDDER